MVGVIPSKLTEQLVSRAECLRVRSDSEKNCVGVNVLVRQANKPCERLVSGPSYSSRGQMSQTMACF